VRKKPLVDDRVDEKHIQIDSETTHGAPVNTCLVIAGPSFE